MITIYFMILLSFLISITLTPFVIKLSKKYKLVDIPKDDRRVHIKPMPRVGGIAIVISVFIALLVYYIITKDTISLVLDTKVIGYVIGALIIALMGLIDDIYNMRARYKFIFQFLAAVVICSFGIVIDTAKIPFIYKELIDLGIFSIPITFLWIIGITNAFNLIDGLDGLASGISTIASASLLIIFIATSSSLEAIIISAILLGSTIGFLPYNFNPAKTFMGDVGSNFLGFTLAVVSILGLAKGYTMVAVIAPLCVLGVPIFDTLFAMVRRFLAGKPMLSPDGKHVHHRLLKKGFNQKQSVLILYTITSLLCILAVVIIAPDVLKLILLIFASIICLTLAYVVRINKNKKG